MGQFADEDELRAWYADRHRARCHELEYDPQFTQGRPAPTEADFASAVKQAKADRARINAYARSQAQPSQRRRQAAAPVRTPVIVRTPVQGDK